MSFLQCRVFNVKKRSVHVMSLGQNFNESGLDRLLTLNKRFVPFLCNSDFKVCPQNEKREKKNRNTKTGKIQQKRIYGPKTLCLCASYREHYISRKHQEANHRDALLFNSFVYIFLFFHGEPWIDLFNLFSV